MSTHDSDDDGDEAFESADEDEIPSPLTSKTFAVIEGEGDVETKDSVKTRTVAAENIIEVALPSILDAAEVAESESDTAPIPPSTSAPEIPLKASPTAVPSQPASGWGSSWSTWGASILSTASHSISQLSTEVAEGLNVLADGAKMGEDESDAPEASIDTPPVVEAQPAMVSARSSPVEDATCPREVAQNKPIVDDSGIASFASGIFSSASSITGVGFSLGVSGLVEGSLNVLERVGRKTMDVLKESDPQFERTRTIFEDRRRGPTLSKLLREGRRTKELEEAAADEALKGKRDTFEHWFDEYEGMVHVEALELLHSRIEREIVDVLSDRPDADLDSSLVAIKDIFLHDEDDDEPSTSSPGVDVAAEVLVNHLGKFGVAFSPNKLIEARSEAISAATKMADAASRDKTASGAEETNSKSTSPSAKDAHRDCIRHLASLAARNVEMFHKVGEMALMEAEAGGRERSKNLDGFLERINHLVAVEKIAKADCDAVAAAFAQTLTVIEATESSIEVNQLMTDAFLESSRAADSLESAFKLLLPVMQRVYLREIDEN